MNQQGFNPDKFEKLFREELESKSFKIPKENLANLLPIWVKVLEVNSLEKLDCDIDIYGSILNELLKEDPELNLFNVSFLINGLTKTSAKDLELTAFEYHRVGFYSKDLATLWNDIVIPIRKELMNKLKKEATLIMPKNGRFVNPNLRK